MTAESLGNVFPEEHFGLLRSMNRSGLLLSACGLSLDEQKKELIRSKSERVAIYCVADQGVPCHQEILEYMASPSAGSYAKNLPPKWILQSSLGLVAAPLAILLNVQGGIHSFQNLQMACLDALGQARRDLLTEVVDVALICAVSSAEDPLITYKYEKLYGVEIQEGARVLAVSRGHQEISLPVNELIKGAPSFGIADPIMKFKPQLQGFA